MSSKAYIFRFRKLIPGEGAFKGFLFSESAKNANIKKPTVAISIQATITLKIQACDVKRLFELNPLPIILKRRLRIMYSGRSSDNLIRKRLF